MTSVIGRQMIAGRSVSPMAIGTSHSLLGMSVDRMIDPQDVGPGEILGRGAMINLRTSKVLKTHGTSLSRRVSHSTILRKYPDRHGSIFG